MFTRLLSIIMTILAVGFTHAMSNSNSGNAAQQYTGNHDANLSGAIRVAYFEADASPPVGSHMAYSQVQEPGELPLSARGVVLVGNDEPLVLLAVDWIGVYNETWDIWREILAEAAGTTPQHVSIHSLHQHDAPRADFTVARILSEYNISEAAFENKAFVEQTMRNTADELRIAMENDLHTITHVGTGQGIVRKVASNRRILDREGNVQRTRFTSGGSNFNNREAPVGVIDPEVKLLTLWSGDEPVVALSYYATHPQSYYRTGSPSPDFPGMARAMMEETTGVPHIHFNGAGGNIGAGKWNDGSSGYRSVLANRLAEGKTRAWEQTDRIPVNADQMEWRTETVILPPRRNIIEEEVRKILADEAAENRGRAARELAILQRYQSGQGYDLSALRIGPARLLHTPAELAVEYQLFAQSIYPDDFIANASYTDVGPGYISTEIQYYQEGGYESSDRASRVAPEVEAVLRTAIRNLLAFDDFQPEPRRLAGCGYQLERSAIQRGHDGYFSWVHARADVIPPAVSNNPIGKPTVVLTARHIDPAGSGSSLHTFRSRDLGMSWEGPFELSGYKGTEPVVGNLVRNHAMSSLTPLFHEPSGTMLGFAEIRDTADGREMHETFYGIYDPRTQDYSSWQSLPLPGDAVLQNVRSASVQAMIDDDGSILLPVYSRNSSGGKFNTVVVRFNFDGEKLEYVEHGNVLTVESGDGLYEPSVAKSGGFYYLAFRNGRDAFVAQSRNGMQFDSPRTWTFDNGEPIGSYNTPQRWVTQGDNLYLAYTRFGAGNDQIYRHRAPLFLARVDKENLQVLSQTEEIIVPDHGVSPGNFGVTRINDRETWVLAVEGLQPAGIENYGSNNKIHTLRHSNNIHIARIKWLEP